MKKIIVTIILSLLCKYAKTQTVFAMGSGVNYEIHCLFADTSSNKIYASGTFTQMDGKNINYIAVWDGNQWDSIGITFGIGIVNSISSYKGEIYAGAAGYLDTSGQWIYDCLTKWDGTKWVSACKGGSCKTLLNDFVENMYVSNNELYVTGRFDTIGGVQADMIAKFDGVNWFAFPPLDSFSLQNGSIIKSCIMYKGELYVAGGFTSPYNSKISKIARFDGVNWNPVGNGFSNWAGINDLVVYKNELYAAGSFDKAHGDPGDNIAKWDGTNWSEVGTKFIPGTQQIGEYNNKLYCREVINNYVYLCEWDGTNWTTGLGFNYWGDVHNFTTLNNDLYISGFFSSVGGKVAHDVARLSWSTAIEESQLTNLLQILPSVSDGLFTINALTKSKTTVSIYNIIDEQIFAFDLIGESKSLDMSSHPTGVYIVKAQTEKNIFSQKIIVAH